MWAIPTGASWLLKKKISGQESQFWSRVPETGSDPPIGSGRDSGRDTDRTSNKSGFSLSPDIVPTGIKDEPQNQLPQVLKILTI